MCERKFNERLLLDFKETGEEKLFEQIINDKDLKKYLYYVCNQKLRNYPSTLMTFEDFTSIGYLIIWQFINKYRFICPICGIKTKTEIMYKLHTINKHNKFYEPKKSISQYIKFNLGAYLQNEVKKEYSKFRKINIEKNVLFNKNIEEEITYYEEFEFSFNMENDIIFKNSINSLIKNLDSLSKEIFIYIYKYKLKRFEIAKIFFKQKKYSSEKSACVMISRIIKNKIQPLFKNRYNLL